MCLKFRVMDIIREVESEIESFHAMLDVSVIVHQCRSPKYSRRGERESGQILETPWVRGCCEVLDIDVVKFQVNQQMASLSY